jgi:ADP-ribose pyrophosphatase YjhB (NUDIX family)
MQQKYEVYIDGKRLTIVGMDDAPNGSDPATQVYADQRDKVHSAIDAWQRSGAEELVVVGRDVNELWQWFCAGYRFVQAAGGCVTNEQLRLLAIHRLGVWDLPKGKVDEGEAVDAAAVREVREECGLVKVELRERLCETWHTYERKGHKHLKRTDWYLMQASSGERLVAQQEEDISEVRWMDQNGIAELRAGTYPSLLGVIDAWERAVRRSA